MEARLVDTTPTVRNDALARCLIAIELSKASWVVGVQTPLSNKTSQYRLAGGDWQSLLKLIERIRRQVSRELGRPVEMISCYEAGYDGFWLHRLLEAHGVRNHVLDPVVGEVFYRSFDNRRQVGGYIGLAPSPYSSGSMDRDQGISKAGNPKARSSARTQAPGGAVALPRN